MIVVIDYGMGNLRSVSKALESLGAPVRVSSRPEDVDRAAKLVLPGVGAFPAAMRELAARGLAEPIARAISSGRPYLGICLGLQVLFERSEEGQGAVGLGILRGDVKRFSTAPLAPRPSPLKVPHMGWNAVDASGAGRWNRCPLLHGVPEGSFFYFVHSYYAAPTDPSVVAGQTEYGTRFASLIRRDNLYATQFHPEKSQAVGLRLLDNFIRL